MHPKLLANAVLVIPLAITGLSGCAHPEPREQLQGEIKSALSWSASLQLGISAWSTRKVPSPYTRDLVAQAADGWGGSAETIKQLPPGKERDDVLADLAKLRKIAEGLNGAVQARRREAAPGQLRQLQLVEGDLRRRQEPDETAHS